VSALRVAVRVGVVASVAFACLLGAGRLDDAVAVFDFQADANSAATFNERTYPEIVELPGSAKVIEDARLWMREDASYRVVDGPRATEVLSGSVRTFLDVLLMPRRRTQLESTPWTFCNGCKRSSLGPEYEILSVSGYGFQFARRRP
jgi:hypothetical protein